MKNEFLIMDTSPSMMNINFINNGYGSFRFSKKEFRELKLIKSKGKKAKYK